ncbi:MAG: NAD-binding protein [Halobacteriota archaeon]
MTVSIYVFGGTHVGRRLATQLAAWFDVTHVDENPPPITHNEDNTHLADEPFASTLTVRQATLTNSEELDALDLSRPTLVVAATFEDRVNLFVAQYARTKLDADAVVSLVVDPRVESAFSDLGIDTICVPCVLADVMTPFVGSRYEPDASTAAESRVECECAVGSVHGGPQ